MTRVSLNSAVACFFIFWCCVWFIIKVLVCLIYTLRSRQCEDDATDMCNASSLLDSPDIPAKVHALPPPVDWLTTVSASASPPPPLQASLCLALCQAKAVPAMVVWSSSRCTWIPYPPLGLLSPLLASCPCCSCTTPVLPDPAVAPGRRVDSQLHESPSPSLYSSPPPPVLLARRLYPSFSQPVLHTSFEISLARG